MLKFNFTNKFLNFYRNTYSRSNKIYKAILTEATFEILSKYL